jgi:hypothetical protein
MPPLAPVPPVGETTDKYGPVDFATHSEWTAAFPDLRAPLAVLFTKARVQAQDPPRYAYHVATPSKPQSLQQYGKNKPLDFAARISSTAPAVPFHPMTHVRYARGEEPRGFYLHASGEIYPLGDRFRSDRKRRQTLGDPTA